MDMTTAVQLIQTIGFPMFVALVCGWYIYKTDKRYKDEAKAREDKACDYIKDLADALNKSSEAISNSTKINSELSETNKMLANELKAEIGSVGKTVEKIYEQVSK
jgi:predicted translin family RNA/ssDNA-binding protein